MDKFDKEKFEKELERSYYEDLKKYQKQAEEYINSLDFERLEEIKKKTVQSITEEDLEFIGFQRIHDDEFEVLYNYTDFNNIKIYFHRLPDRFEELGFRLRKEMDIFTIEELLERSLTRWRLRLNENKPPNFKIDWDEKSPF